MSISTNYNNGYGQYNNQVNGHHRHHMKKAQGTDSSEQATQLIDAVTQGVPNNKSKNPLDNLVEAGTITSDQEKAIQDAFKEARMAYKAQEGTTNATGTVKDPLDSLVEAGTITKEQENSIKDAFNSKREMHRIEHSQHNKKPELIMQALDNLTKDGTITNSQEDAIKNAIQSAIKSYQKQSYSEDDSTSSGSFATSM